MGKPDYSLLREQAGFSWSVSGTQGALRAVANVPIRDFNLEPEACIEAYRKGRPAIREIFGDDVALPAVSTPAISYGHVNVLGSELLFPEGGEVAHTHPFKSLDEAIRALNSPVDFLSSGMAAFYIGFREKMKKAFPGEDIGFGYGKIEGPATTAWELLGEEFFAGILDQPGRTKELLDSVVRSMLEFRKFVCELTGSPVFNPEGSGIADDIPSMLSPEKWPEFILPFWERYYSATTTGARSAHAEDLKPAHLKFLEKAGLSYFDPSVSGKLNPEIIFKACRVPFSWRLVSFQYRGLSPETVRDFVLKSAADGATVVTSNFTGESSAGETPEKVKSFIRAGKEAKKLLEDGLKRRELEGLMSPAGRDKFWDKWPQKLA